MPTEQIDRPRRAAELDVFLQPVPEHQAGTVTEARRLRVYASSLPGLVSVSASREGILPEGLRIDRQQVAHLHEKLGKWLAATR